MRTNTYPVEEPTSTAIDGQKSSASAKTVRPISFGELARFAFPQKTDQHLSFHTGVDARTCRRWIRGDNGAPQEALNVVLLEIMQRLNSKS